MAFGRDEEYLERALADDEALVRLARRRSWTAGAASALAVAFAGIAVIGLLAVAIPAAGEHRLPGYMLAVLPLVALGAFETVPPVADAVSRLSHHLAAARRVLAIADLPTPVHDPEDPVTEPTGTEIALKEARLRYGADHPWALDGLTMSVPAARRVALVGPSGAGKSSVVNTLLRFWALESGEATAGGNPTGPSLPGDAPPHDRLGSPGHPPVQHDDTGEHRARPTRGERSRDRRSGPGGTTQRLDQLTAGTASTPRSASKVLSSRAASANASPLARALLARTPVLILDEPTSGLDEATAERLLSDVLATTTGKSLLYVTHRLDELAAFDEVDVIDNGRVVGRSVP